MPRQPHLASMGRTQLPIQDEMLASGNHLVGCQVEATVQTASTDAALYRPGEPVSDPRQGLDPRGFGFSEDRRSAAEGKSVSVRLNLGWRRFFKKKIQKMNNK